MVWEWVGVGSFVPVLLSTGPVVEWNAFDGVRGFGLCDVMCCVKAFME
jgi:hypothetical protein